MTEEELRAERERVLSMRNRADEIRGYIADALVGWTGYRTFGDDAGESGDDFSAKLMRGLVNAATACDDLWNGVDDEHLRVMREMRAEGIEPGPAPVVLF